MWNNNENSLDKKEFLLPNNILSKAVIHSKLFKKPIGYIKTPCVMIDLTDCKRSIQLYSDISTIEGREEILLKIRTLKSHLSGFENKLLEHFKNLK